MTRAEGRREARRKLATELRGVNLAQAGDPIPAALALLSARKPWPAPRGARERAAHAIAAVVLRLRADPQTRDMPVTTLVSEAWCQLVATGGVA